MIQAIENVAKESVDMIEVRKAADKVMAKNRKRIEVKMQSKVIAKLKCNQKWLQNQNAIKNDCIFCLVVVKSKKMEVQL